MEAGEAPGHVGRLLDRLPQGLHGVPEHVEALGGHGRAEPSDAEGVHRLDDAADLLRAEPRVAEFLAAVAVDLDIQQPGGHPRPRGRFPGFDLAGPGLNDPRLFDFQPDRQAGIVTSSFDLHGPRPP